MKTVIAINGPPRAGKDTAVDMMTAHLEETGIPTLEYSSIQPVKDMLADYVDLKAKTPADRRLLALVGDALQEHSGFRTNNSLFQISEFFDKHDDGVFFLHMREPDLIDKVLAGCRVLGINFIRVFMESDRAEDVQNNAADAGVRDGTYDCLLVNNGTLEDLAEECLQFLKSRRLLNR